MQEERSIANGTAKREPSGPAAYGESGDSSSVGVNYGVAIAEVARQGESRPPGFEDPDKSLVHLVNSVPESPPASPAKNYVLGCGDVPLQGLAVDSRP